MPPFSSVGTRAASMGTGLPFGSAVSSGSNIRRSMKTSVVFEFSSGLRFFTSALNRDTQRRRAASTSARPAPLPVETLRATGEHGNSEQRARQHRGCGEIRRAKRAPTLPRPRLLGRRGCPGRDRSVRAASE